MYTLPIITEQEALELLELKEFNDREDAYEADEMEMRSQEACYPEGDFDPSEFSFYFDFDC